MNLIVISNKPYQQDFRKYLLLASRKHGALAAHIYCWSEVRINTDQGEIAPLPFDIDHPELRRLADMFDGGKNTIVLSGMNGFKSKFAMQLKHRFPEATFVFDVFDDFRYGSRGAKAFQWLRRDIKWRLHCDLSMVLERGMLWRYPGGFHLDNASHLGIARKSDAPPGAAVVYIGSIDGRTDFQMIERFLYAGIAVDMYGAVHASMPEGHALINHLLQKHSKARYFGAYANDDLQNILSKYDVGIVPYATSSSMTKHINPDKIYHYLNAGLNVIASDIPQARRMQSHLTLIRRDDAPKRILEKAREENRASTWDLAQNSWSARWQLLEQHIVRHHQKS